MNDAGRAARGLLVGRFQPFHLGHLSLVRSIRSARPDEELLLAIGSSQESYTRENPFTASERFEMITLALRGAGLTGVLAVPLPDIHRHALWVAHAEELLPSFRRVYTNNPLTRILFTRSGYPVESPELVQRERFEGRTIRALLASGAGWEDRVPPEVAHQLRELNAGARLRQIAEASAPAGTGAP